MAEYTVPQDVEAEDKLLGPFSFRQFLYLIVMVAGIGVAWLLGNMLLPLAIIPLPIIIIFGALALPIRKDQPMETYLVALVNFYLKPHKRLWTPGQPESTIQISAPKKAEGPYKRNLSADEVSHRLSYLSNLVDESGRIMEGGTNSLQASVFAEAAGTKDMYEAAATNTTLNQSIESANEVRHKELVAKMAEMIKTSEPETFDNMPTMDQSASVVLAPAPAVIEEPLPTILPPDTIASAPEPSATPSITTLQDGRSRVAPTYASKATAIHDTTTIIPDSAPAAQAASLAPTPGSAPIVTPVTQALSSTPVSVTTVQAPAAPAPNAAMQNLVEQKDLSIETIAGQAKRVKEQQGSEVFVSLRGDQ